MPKTRSPGDGGLYYLKSKKLWRGVVELAPIDGKRRQKVVTAKLQRDCKAKLDALKDEIRANNGEPINRGMTVSAWAEKWLQDYARRNVDPKTFSSYKSASKNWIVAKVGRKRVADLKPSDIHAVLNGIRSAGKSLSLAKTTYIVMDQMFEEARREGACATNVVRDVSRPGGRKSSGRSKVAAKREALDLDAVLQLLATSKPMPDGSRWWFKIFTGQRQSEILGAVLEDLELDIEAWGEPGFYTVNWKLEELLSEHGCGERVDDAWPCGKKRGGSCSHRQFIVPNDFDMRPIKGRWHLTRPKSQTGKRTPLVPELADIIRLHLHATKAKPNPHGLIWHDGEGDPIEIADDTRGWLQLLLAAGIITEDEAQPGGTTLTGHTARHTTITDLGEAGVDMHLIGKMVGQSSERVTAAYRHARDQEMLNAANTLAVRYLPPAKEAG